MLNKRLREPWIMWLVSLPEYSSCARIASRFLFEPFNFYGLASQVRHYDLAMQTLKGLGSVSDSESDSWQNDVTLQTIKLFALIHQRFIQTRAGLQEMYRKYTNDEFEPCPRVLCGGTRCLPYGSSERYGESKAALFCPNCGEVYDATGSLAKLDGAFFGPSWVHLFVRLYPDIVPQTQPKKYVPRIFGMKVCVDEDAITEGDT